MRAVDLAARVTGAKPRSDGWLAICPAHDDQNASLTFRDGEKGVLLKCQAGCQTEIVCECLGLKVRDLFFERTPSNGQPTRRIVQTYDYCDEHNALLYQVVRYAPKDFRQRRPDGKGGWAWDLHGVRLVAYRLPDLPGHVRVYQPEGEKDVDRLRSQGLPATCNSGGAGKWVAGHAQQVKAAGVHEVIILPDNDEPGRQHAQAVARSYVDAGLVAKIVTLPDLPPKGDVSNWFDAGGTTDDLHTLADAAPSWVPPEAHDAEDHAEAALRLTDVGNAELFARQHRDNIHYCYPFRSWFVCNTALTWERCPGNLVMQLGKATVIGLYDLARNEPDEARRTKLAAHAVKSESAQRLQALIDLARSEPGIAISPNDFDRDPWLFNVVNGVLDLKTGLCRARRRDDLITKQSPVVFDPSASCPTWLRFLSRIFQDDHRLIAYLQQVVGYCLTGVTREQEFYILWGSGANGKSTLLKILRALCGDYGVPVAAETFLVQKQDGRARPDLVKLQGARLAAAIEMDDGGRLSEGTIKKMTGGDPLTVRDLYTSCMDFEPTHKILFATNHKPRIKDSTHAMWRRVRLIPFEVQIPTQDQDPDLFDKLLVELPGLLNWALAGCLAWQRAGRLHAPKSVVAATQTYRKEQDILEDFLREYTVEGPAETVRFSELRQAYVAWTKEISDKAMSSKAFAAALSERGFRADKIHNARHYQGLRLRTAADAVVLTPAVAPGGEADVDLD